jgi:hypothetical protein
MVTELIPNLTTTRRQFDAIIEGIEQEAIAAAGTLGLTAKSKESLLKALYRELDYWEREWCFEPEPDRFATYPKSWDRVVCVEIIRFLLEEMRQFVADDDVCNGFDEVDGNLAVLRRRLLTANHQLAMAARQ